MNGIPLQSSQGIEPWGAMDGPALLDRLRELADAEGLTLRDAARKFATVEIPTNKNSLAWRWHSWLGFTLQR